MAICSDIDFWVNVWLDKDNLFSIFTNGDIRWKKGDRVMTLEEFHKELIFGYRKGNEPSKLVGRILELREPFNIDDEMAKHLVGGTLVQYGRPAYASSLGYEWELVALSSKEATMDVQEILDKKHFVFCGDPLFIADPPLWLEDGDEMTAVSSTQVSGLTGIALEVDGPATITMEVGFFRQLYALGNIQDRDGDRKEPEDDGDHDGQVYNPYTKRWSWI